MVTSSKVVVTSVSPGWYPTGPTPLTRGPCGLVAPLRPLHNIHLHGPHKATTHMGINP